MLKKRIKAEAYQCYFSLLSDKYQHIRVFKAGCESALFGHAFVERKLPRRKRSNWSSVKKIYKTCFWLRSFSNAKSNVLLKWEIDFFSANFKTVSYTHSLFIVSSIFFRLVSNLYKKRSINS